MGLKDFIVEEGVEHRDIEQVEKGGWEYQAPTNAAPNKSGVTYVGDFESPGNGMAVAVRRHAKALYLTGVPLHLRSRSFLVANHGVVSLSEYSELDKDVLGEIDMITQSSFDEVLLTIQHLVPTVGALEEIVFPRNVMAYSPEGAARLRALTIVNTVIERDRVSGDVAGLLNQVGRVWVPCEQNRQALITSGVAANKVVAIGHPYFDDDPFLTKGEARSAPPFRFLHIGKWEPRKDQHRLIGAFLLAFTPKDDVELVLKCGQFGSWHNYPLSIAHSVVSWLRDDDVQKQGWTEADARRAIKVMTKHMPRADLAKLYRECDCYVSCGHAEGFDLPAFDAKLSGLPMIYVPFGGPSDFADVRSDIAVAVKQLEDCHAGYGWTGCRWAMFGVLDLVAALTEARSRKIRCEADYLQAKFGSQSVGQAMRRSCAQLFDELGGDFEGMIRDTRRG